MDVDIRKFFDRVNDDILMARLARHVTEKRGLRIVRRFLEAGRMQGGEWGQRPGGTPQGGPLTPWMANLWLDDLDKEQERRGTAAVAMRTTATSTCGRSERESGGWRWWSDVWQRGCGCR